MRAGESAIADHFAAVTILFCDIVDFTRLAGRVAPVELIEMLNRLFTGFDHLAVERGLEKIKTIGDAYMVVGGLPEPTRGPRNRGRRYGAARCSTWCTRPAPALGRPLSVRIGIHTGPVVAGVIGRNKFIYDVWGDTVNTASRMETYGAPGRVHVSDATQQLIDDAFRCEARDALDVRGKGVMQTFFVTGRSR